MKIGMIGIGFVGGATAEVLREKHEMLLYDKYRPEFPGYEGRINTQEALERMTEAEAIFLSLPTPMRSDGMIDLGPIHNSIRRTDEVFKGVTKEERPLIILRSTAVSGTTDSLEAEYEYHFAFNPEFLVEKTALEDMRNTKRVVIGAKRKEDHELVERIYQEVFPKAKYHRMATKEAEAVKYFANVALAGQVMIANALYEIFNTAGLDYDKIREVAQEDERIGRNMKVPGPDKDLGFGGKCFPKDLNALISYAKNLGVKPHLLETIWKENLRLRLVRDWEEIPGATSSKGFE
ncbi:hypothetical protein COU61_03025 [Candidatus Pacearchaeota archaeon CG10_big_fil_rev_8_21_14_0_10_35_13]|nr:MAG: hypothetical protein COU61_03025 [Candidatus Pacearchaeota archaeon CG10_big_fil_rev_8_21_14_0_10_35_13]